MIKAKALRERTHRCIRQWVIIGFRKGQCLEANNIERAAHKIHKTQFNLIQDRGHVAIPLRNPERA